jgi:hypothetical protein
VISIVAWKSLAAPATEQAPIDPPGETIVSENITLNAVAGGPCFVMGPASAFRPRSSETEYAFSGPRLQTVSLASATYDAPVTLPHGAEITKFILYYRDNASSDVYATLYRAPLPDRFGYAIASVSSSGASTEARYSETTTISDPVIDLQQYAYYINLLLPGAFELEVNGYRIDYSFGVALPLILKQHPPQVWWPGD